MSKSPPQTHTFHNWICKETGPSWFWMKLRRIQESPMYWFKNNGWSWFKKKRGREIFYPWLKENERPHAKGLLDSLGNLVRSATSTGMPQSHWFERLMTAAITVSFCCKELWQETSYEMELSHWDSSWVRIHQPPQGKGRKQKCTESFSSLWSWGPY